MDDRSQTGGEDGMVDGGQATPVARAPEVLVQQLPDDELVFLNLETEDYYGLDSVGTEMWSALTETGRTDLALERLLASFDTDEETLSRDLELLVHRLSERGLLLVGKDALGASPPPESI